MTVGALMSIIFGAIFMIGGLIIGTVMCSQGDTASGVTTIIICLVVGMMFIGGAVFYLNTESGKRAIKDMESELNNGIQRTVSVYDINGELIKEYSGKFDVETGSHENAPYILFDDDKGKRHIVYYTTGTILIDEN